jgi:hypothetical protein
MIHIYKHGGAWNRDGIDYTVKVVSFKRLEDCLSKGWVESFEELKTSDEEVDGGSRERYLRDEIYRITGKKPGPASKMETLERLHKEAMAEESDGD